MKINWKLRLKNKSTLTALVLGIVALVYQVLSTLGITPSIAESEIVNIVGMVINLLLLMGVVVDPTTTGISDSDRAMTYGNFDTEESLSMGKGSESDEL